MLEWTPSLKACWDWASFMLGTLPTELHPQPVFQCVPVITPLRRLKPGGQQCMWDMRTEPEPVTGGVCPQLGAQAALTENPGSVFHTHVATPSNSCSNNFNTPSWPRGRWAHLVCKHRCRQHKRKILDYWAHAFLGDWGVGVNFCSLKMCTFLGTETLDSRVQTIFFVFGLASTGFPNFTFYI